MNMYAIIYNEFVKDLVIARDEEDAKDTMIAFNRDCFTGIEPETYDNLPIVRVPDDLRFVTIKGLVSVRELVDAHMDSKYWIAVDSKSMQFGEGIT